MLGVAGAATVAERQQLAARTKGSGNRLCRRHDARQTTVSEAGVCRYRVVEYRLDETIRITRHAASPSSRRRARLQVGSARGASRYCLRPPIKVSTIVRLNQDS